MSIELEKELMLGQLYDTHVKFKRHVLTLADYVTKYTE